MYKNNYKKKKNKNNIITYNLKIYNYKNNDTKSNNYT